MLSSSSGLTVALARACGISTEYTGYDGRLRTSSAGPGGVGPILTMFPHFHWGGWSFLHNAWASRDDSASSSL